MIRVFSDAFRCFYTERGGLVIAGRTILKSLAVLFLSSIALNVIAQGEVEEVLVEAEYIPDEKLATSEVADLLDAETMSIAGDSDLGGALKRVPGLSLVGGKFIYVRGLGERYSATYFNSTLMPSPEPLQRAVPLDLFDTSITKDVLVQKTHSSNYGIEFSGGAVDIRTAVIPDQNFFKIKVSSSYNDISTGQSGLKSAGGSRDWLGYDDGGRELPDTIAGNLDRYPDIFTQANSDGSGGLPVPEQDRARLSFTNNDWEPSRTTNPYDYGFSLGGGMRYQITERVDIGFIGIASLSNKWRNRFQESASYVPDNVLVNTGVLVRNIEQIREFGLNDRAIEMTDPETGETLQFDNLGVLTIEEEERTQRKINTNTLLSIGSVIDQQHFINVTNLIARNTTDTASRQVSAKYNPDIAFRSDTLIDYVENEINFKQLSAEHILDSANIKWRYALVDALRDNLDSKEVSEYSNDSSAPRLRSDNFTVPSRSFSYLDDTTRDMGVDFDVPFTSDRRFVTDFNLKFGASLTVQKRRFDGYVFAYNLAGLGGSVPEVLELPMSVLADSSACVVGEDPELPITVDTQCFLAANYSGEGGNLGGPAGTIVIQDGSDSPTGDFYSGTSEIEAQYLVIDAQILEVLRFNVGVRKERSLIEVRGGDGELFGPAQSLPPSQLRSTDQNSSFSLTWDFYKNMILRAAYSETVNRPILRELAPIRLFNPADGRYYVGNSALRTAELENFDVRYEMYFGENDYFSISAFKKRIDQPIEVFQRETAGEIIASRWENSDFAINEGYEVEIRKYFTPELYITSNATFIDSEVQDSDANLNLLQRSNINKRPLTGVSRELYNFQIIYDDALIKASLSYNKYSRRVDSLLVSPVGATFSLVMEEPFASLDANFKWKIPVDESSINLGFKATNLLDESIERNVVNLGGLPYERYDVGQTYSFSLEWKQ